MSKVDKTKTPGKPLLFADNPLNDARVSGSEGLGSMDASFVPGYSNVRQNNDLRRAKGQKPLPQNARAQWVRVTRKSGEYVSTSDEGMMEWMRLGYVACGLDDLKRLGWSMPPTAQVGEDGLIRRGDLALFYVDAERAEENRAEQRGTNVEAGKRDLDIKSPEVKDVEDERVDMPVSSLEEVNDQELPDL